MLKEWLNQHLVTESKYDLPARLLKEIASKIAPVLTVIFQASLDQGNLPNIWKTAAIPIFNKLN